MVSKRVVLADVPWTPKTRNKGTKNGTTDNPKPERGHKKLNDGIKNRNEGTFQMICQNHPFTKQPFRILSAFLRKTPLFQFRCTSGCTMRSRASCTVTPLLGGVPMTPDRKLLHKLCLAYRETNWWCIHTCCEVRSWTNFCHFET